MFLKLVKKVDKMNFEYLEKQIAFLTEHPELVQDLTDEQMEVLINYLQKEIINKGKTLAELEKAYQD